MLKRLTIWIAAILVAIVGCCVAWQVRNSRVSGSVVEQKATEVLKTVGSLELTNSWRSVNATGGLVGSPFYSIRWWREYFIEKEGDAATLEALSNELGRRHSRLDFMFLPSGDASTIMPHSASAVLAPWWQPETNGEPMYMFAQFGGGDVAVFLYGYKKTTNSLLYIHIKD